jgi:predicted ATPase/DNA-binding winged helix-turn-helix (wHTH) protein
VLDEELRQSNQVAAFGPFRLFPKRRLVEKDGVPIGLSGRALDILILLTERAGEVVSKKELTAHVWPDVVVTEGSLRFHVGVLRKALGDGQPGARYVPNVSGRGYCFVAPILQSDSIGPLAEQSYTPDKTHNLPRQLTRLVGRDETIESISAQLLNRRFVTIVGPGGIGKTSVAMSVASALLAAFDGAIRFVDLGPLTDPQLVPSTLASLLGLPAQTTYSASSLVKVLGQKRILLVFDSCEHVIETASELAQQLIQGTPHVHILATSRESLRVEGEQIHRLFPLAGPPDDAALTRAGDLAEMFHDIDHQMLALVGLATACHRLEQFHEGLSLSRRAEATAKTIADPLPSWIAHCLLSTSYFFLGEYADALSNAQKVHRVTTPGVRRAHIVRIGLDRAAVADCVAVQVLFVRGLLDQAAETTRDIVDCARAVDHPYSLCLALTWSACPITLALGDFEAAQQWTALLKRYSEKYDLKSQYACALGFEGQLAASRGETKSALKQLRACLTGLREAQYESLYTVFLDSLAEVLAAAGHLDEALVAADEALQRTERNEALWWMPEALRIKGELLLRSRKRDTASAEELFRRSLALTHRQGALFWELRTATSLACLHHERGHRDDARAGLAMVCDRFSEGFDSKDYKTAKGFLDSLT